MNALICVLALLSASSSPDEFQAARQKQWLLLQYKSDLGLTPSQLAQEKEKLDQLSPEQVDTLVGDYVRERNEALQREGSGYRNSLRNGLSGQRSVDLGLSYVPDSTNYSYSPYWYYWPTFYVPYRPYSYRSGYGYVPNYNSVPTHNSVPNHTSARNYSYARSSSGRSYHPAHATFHAKSTSHHHR